MEYIRMGETMITLLLFFACSEAEFLYECECFRQGSAKTIEEGGVDEILDEIFVQKICETDENFEAAFQEGGSMTKALDECETTFSEEYNNVTCACNCEYVGPCE